MAEEKSCSVSEEKVVGGITTEKEAKTESPLCVRQHHSRVLVLYCHKLQQSTAVVQLSSGNFRMAITYFFNTMTRALNYTV